MRIEISRTRVLKSHS